MAAQEHSVTPLARVNILSLDGGGTWALIQARALAHLYGEATPGHAILADFDLAFANSGGSLVLAGLLADMPPARIAEYFTNPADRRAMFTRRWYAPILDLAGFGPRYSTAAKAAHLRAIFGDRPLVSLERPGAARPRTAVAMMAYDYDRNRAFFFRSAPSRRQPVVRATLADAVHASSTAPVNWFDAPARVNVGIDYQANPPASLDVAKTFWDGGVTGLNNPAAAAVAEATATGADPADIAVLSIGTGAVAASDNPAHTADDPSWLARPSRRGLVADVAKAAAAITADPPDFATFLAHAATRGGGRPMDAPGDTQVARLSPLILPAFVAGRWVLPTWADARGFARLRALDLAVTDDADVALIDRLITAWLQDDAPNQPIRANFLQPDPRGLHVEIGHAFASQAIARWRAIKP